MNSRRKLLCTRDFDVPVPSVILRSVLPYESSAEVLQAKLLRRARVVHLGNMLIISYTRSDPGCVQKQAAQNASGLIKHGALPSPEWSPLIQRKKNIKKHSPSCLDCWLLKLNRKFRCSSCVKVNTFPAAWMNLTSTSLQQYLPQWNAADGKQLEVHLSYDFAPT